MFSSTCSAERRQEWWYTRERKRMSSSKVRRRVLGSPVHASKFRRSDRNPENRSDMYVEGFINYGNA